MITSIIIIVFIVLVVASLLAINKKLNIIIEIMDSIYNMNHRENSDEN